MSSLQEVLTLLLGAESEARRKSEEARAEAEEIIARTRQDFQREREDRLSAAREQALGLIESAENAAEAEVRQIVNLGQQEAQDLTERFGAYARETVDSLVDEMALHYVRKGTR